MTDWGAHHFDIIQWALGMDHSGPISVNPANQEKGEPLTIQYQTGTNVRLERNEGNSIRFMGTEGSIVVNRQGIQTDPERLAKSTLKSNDMSLYYSNDHLANWLDCIRARKRPICDVEIGCRSVTVCHLGNIAAWLERPLRWDPVSETFPDDPGANRYLDRAKRNPWVV